MRCEQPGRGQRPKGMSGQSELEHRIAYYRRSGSFDQGLLIKILKQAGELGAEYVLSNVSSEARQFYRAYRGVIGEAHRAKAFLRFKETGEGWLVARAEFDNDVADLVLRHFMNRFPMKKVVIVSGGGALVGCGGRMMQEDAEWYGSGKPGGADDCLRGFVQGGLGETSRAGAGNVKDPLWETFYASQNIDARRNRRLALKNVPKKLWKQFGISEAALIDHGVPTARLTDFIEAV